MMNMNQYGNNFVPPYAQNYSNFFGYRDNNPQQTNQTTTNLIWVQGIEGAKAYMLTPGSNALLLDSEIENRAYIKMADELGATKLRKFDLIEVIDDETPSKLTDYVRKDELQDLLMSILQKQEKEVIDDEQIVSTTKPIIRKSVG